MKVLLAALLPVLLWGADAPIRGFPRAQSKAQREMEEKLRAIPQPGHIQEYARRMSQKPHHAGSPGSRAVAEYAEGLLRGWGLDARIETFEALLPYPVERSVEIVEPAAYKAVLREPALAEDSDTAETGQLPVYNAYSASGSVTAPLVYVNYGLPEDYEKLKKLGIDVRGKIVLARYGVSWRGTKPKVAYEHGAAGCVIYSDPRDDGYFQGDAYPKGPFRPPQGAQRGSVMDMPLYVGDPLSPGWASEPGSRRLTWSEAKTVMRIPVLPLSYDDARRLLEGLEGPVAPEEWRGALGLTYHIGPGPAVVRLNVETDEATRPVYDVIATLRGSQYPDEWVVYGNHHDAWVNGAQDPVSGAASLLETARALAEMNRQGWKPKRTVILALWDAEEFGLIGSTEWAEKHAEELRNRAVAYLNSDSTGRGQFGGGGSPTLETFTREVARDVADPATARSLLEMAEAGEGKPKEFRLGAPGAGSDYVVFVHHLGIAALNLGISGQDRGGIYHSIYDTFQWYTRFSDGTFVYGAALSKAMATAIARLADAQVLPFEFGSLARNVREYTGEVEKLAGKESGRTDLAAVRKELAKVEKRSRRYEKALERAMGRAGTAPPGRITAVNGILRGAERALTLPDGLPGREWYQHQIYAPGVYTGYEAKTLPGIREALEAGKWDEAGEQAHRVVRVLRTLREQIEKATRALGQI